MATMLQKKYNRKIQRQPPSCPASSPCSQATQRLAPVKTAADSHFSIRKHLARLESKAQRLHALSSMLKRTAINREGAISTRPVGEVPHAAAGVGAVSARAFRVQIGVLAHPACTWAATDDMCRASGSLWQSTSVEAVLSSRQRDRHCLYNTS